MLLPTLQSHELSDVSLAGQYAPRAPLAYSECIWPLGLESLEQEATLHESTTANGRDRVRCATCANAVASQSLLCQRRAAVSALRVVRRWRTASADEDQEQSSSAVSEFVPPPGRPRLRPVRSHPERSTPPRASERYQFASKLAAQRQSRWRSWTVTTPRARRPSPIAS